MKLIMRFSSILIFLCAVFLTEAGFSNAFAVNGNPFTLADSLFSSGNFSEASLEYERAGFETGDHMVKTQALLRKAVCLKKTEMFSKAEAVLGRVNYENLPDSIVYPCRYEHALNAYLAGNFSNAESQLMLLNFYVQDSSLTKSSLCLYALVLNETGKWKDSKTQLDKALRLSSIEQKTKDSISEILQKLYTPSHFPKIKKVGTAQVLDGLFPGSGHLYAGYFWEGVASLSLNAVSLAFLGYSVYSTYYITAFTVGSTNLQTFYMGGMNRAEYLVNKHNYLSKRKYNDQLKAQIVQIQNILK